MSQYSKSPLDFAGLKTVSLDERGGKVKTRGLCAIRLSEGLGHRRLAGFAAAYPGGRFVPRGGGRARRGASKRRAIDLGAWAGT